MIKQGVLDQFWLNDGGVSRYIVQHIYKKGNLGKLKLFDGISFEIYSVENV